MKLRSLLSFWSIFCLLDNVQAMCLASPDITLFLQRSSINRQAPLWQIAGQAPYNRHNRYTDLAVKYQQRGALIADKLLLDIAVYGLANFSDKAAGQFERDDHQIKLLIDQLNVSSQLSDKVRIEVGKHHFNPGLFYLKSPANLLNSYYAGFKSSRFYEPTLQQAYMPTFWRSELIAETANYTLSLVVVPKLAQRDKRYISASNWSAIKRTNAAEGYLFTYTDYRFEKNTPSLNLKLGHFGSLALSNSYQWSSQWVINSELAYHAKQQWRHLDSEYTAQAMGYQFPTSLYQTHKKSGVELALGMQYTSDNFSQFGLEYYFQGEGYSQTQWDKQVNLIHFFNQKMYSKPLSKAFDDYQYLMAAEIDNISNQGYFQRKHYLNGYASIELNSHARLQSYMVLNLRDQSVLMNINYSQILDSTERKVEIYTGLNSTLGRRDSEFGLFGENIGVYFGFKYHL
ncbi:hypothetical protein RHO15_10030 [Utexia brackfieldae]|uniref:hypothetical protein n=1 Tax=Utexia brackfieldae TaxID=3074108 RepID=UPI00370DB82D